jgi:hypothetical protein
MPSSTRIKTTLLGLIVGVTVSGCGDYLSNRDRISPHTGNATASNTAIQTINTWPSQAFNTGSNQSFDSFR